MPWCLWDVHCVSKNSGPMFYVQITHCGAGRSHVGLCPAHLVIIFIYLFVYLLKYGCINWNPYFLNYSHLLQIISCWFCYRNNLSWYPVLLIAETNSYTPEDWQYSLTILSTKSIGPDLLELFENITGVRNFCRRSGHTGHVRSVSKLRECQWKVTRTIWWRLGGENWIPSHLLCLGEHSR